MAESTVPRVAERRARLGRFAFALVLVAVTIRAGVARVPGWNPASLWQDDLVWAALTRAENLRALFSVPAHLPPGFLAILWGSRRVFGDPEWSLQLLPFASGILAIPVMAAVVRRLTQSPGLALLAAGLTALNPLLAHYTVFVKQYSFDFLVTALLLWAAAPMLDGRDVPRRNFAQLSALAALALFFSMTSVFASVPIVNIIALRVWLNRRREAWPIVGLASVFNLMLLVAYLAMRDRTNDLIVLTFWRGFVGSSAPKDIWAFLMKNGRQLIETSLPSWKETQPWNPQTVSWTLPFVGLGFVWLFARRSTRGMGCVVLGFYTAMLLAARLTVYPLGMGRTDIFAFPLAICLFALGVHMLTQWMPGREIARTVLGLAVAGVALYAPVRVRYWDVNDAGLIKYVTALAATADGLILSPNGTFLAAYYGPWPVAITSTTARANATEVAIARNLTLHLSPGDEEAPAPAVEAFLEEFRPVRLWYVAFRTAGEDDVLQASTREGYAMKPVERTTKGTLYLGINLAGKGRE